MQVLFDIAKKEGLQLKTFLKLLGGNINLVFLLETYSEKLVIKLNQKQAFPNMFTQEALALQKLAKTKSFTIPKIIANGEYENYSYLVLQHIPSGVETDKFWFSFAKNLAQLHKNSNRQFGWESKNYIGSLPQFNKYCSTSADFYISQRLQPQFNLAIQNGFKFPKLTSFYDKVQKLIPTAEIPALIHGDLWSGNYMVDHNQNPVLIDPAICYGSREMDLAMMQLFGGFPADVFKVYDKHYPLLEDWTNRIELYQLYYLLVHLNIFGESYLNSVLRIMHKYSS